MTNLDDDLERMSREELIAAVRKLRAAVRKHRDATGHALCWHHPDLWALLLESIDPKPLVPDWPEFFEVCVRYRRSLDEQAPNAPRTKERYDDRSSAGERGTSVPRGRGAVPRFGCLGGLTPSARRGFDQSRFRYAKSDVWRGALRVVIGVGVEDLESTRPPGLSAAR